MSHLCGSFAPPLSDQMLSDYRGVVEALPLSQTKDVLLALLECCETWWELPDSPTSDSEPHPSGRGKVVKLPGAIKKRLERLVPNAEQLALAAGLFDQIPADSQRAPRDMAHHLLWHVKELKLGREPITTDLL